VAATSHAPRCAGRWYAYGGDLNESKILRTAELMVSTGLVQAGYVYLNLDDAWLAPTRDRFGNMVADPIRFPSGIKSLVSKVNRLGIKLGQSRSSTALMSICDAPPLTRDATGCCWLRCAGLYGDPGIRTCMGYPGQFEHEYQDARTLAEWGVEFWKYDQCWHKFPLLDILAVEAYSGSLPRSTELSNGMALGLNVRGMSVVGQDADFAGERIANFTSPESGFVGPQIKIASLPASWERAETWSGGSGEGGIPGTQIQYYEAYRLFGEALASTGANITYSICPFIAGCDRSIWSYYSDVAHLSMNQCPEHDATDSWSSFLWHVDDSMRNGVGAGARPGYFNDLDMLQIGYKELSDEAANRPLMTDSEYRTEYSIFCLLAAPLIMSNDLSRWTPSMEATLLNPEMVALNQDPLGISGRVVFNTTGNHSCVPPSFKEFLQHNLCNDSTALLGGGGTSEPSLDDCASLCAVDARCEFFGFSPKESFCIRYNASCVARVAVLPGDRAPSYTTFKLESRPAAGSCWHPSSGGGMGISSRTPNPNMLVAYARPLHDGSIAVGLMNRDAMSNHSITLNLSAIGVQAGREVSVRDVWARKDQDSSLAENGAAGRLHSVSRIVCPHCTEVLKVRAVDGRPIEWHPW
jgi:hypothetical protein